MDATRVLVVDDDPAMTELIGEQLLAWNCAPTLAESVDEALALLAGRPFDLVLSDLHMPRRDGMALLRLIRESWSEMPVILFSSFPAKETKKQALEAGACAFLSKPFSLDALHEALESERRRRPSA